MKRYLLTILGVLPVLLCCGVLFPQFLLEITGLLAFGWIAFLNRVIPQVTVDWSGMETALISLTGLGVGLHYFCAWLHRQIVANGAQSPPNRWRLRWTVSILVVVVLMFVAGIAAIGLTHQMVWLANSPKVLVYREYTRNTVSRNNLKQIGLGVHNYESAFMELPPGTLFHRNGRALHGWHTLLLPYIEAGATYKQINRELPWNHTANRSALRTIIPTYINPAADRQPSDDNFAFSHYAGNVYVFGTDKAMHISQSFPDGASVTILAGEVPTHFKPWGHPTNWRDPGLGIGHPSGFGNPANNDGALFVMADASCRSFTANVSPEVLKAFAMPSGRKMPADWIEP